jgi:hypothetical protein
MIFVSSYWLYSYQAYNLYWKVNAKRLQGFLKCHSPPPRSYPLPECAALIGLEHTFVTLSEKNHTQKFYVKKAWFSEMSFPSSKVVPLRDGAWLWRSGMTFQKTKPFSHKTF